MKTILQQSPASLPLWIGWPVNTEDRLNGGRRPFAEVLDTQLAVHRQTLLEPNAQLEEPQPLCRRNRV
jgi:hypothetical protein